MRTLSDAGHSCALVGGYVRDSLLGSVPGDVDIATSATPEQVTDLFEKTVPTGIKHGTVTVVFGDGTVEVTTYRREGGYIAARRPESVTYISDIKDDLARRDFTVNAMAISPSGELIDPFGGKRDLEDGIIRCVGDPAARFSEDALRMLRAIRFCARLGFTLEAGTEAAIATHAKLVQNLSAERVRDETVGILTSPRPQLIGNALSLGLYTGRLAGRAAPPELFELCRIPDDTRTRLCAFAAIMERHGHTPTAQAFLNSLRLDSETASVCSSGARLVLGGMQGDRPAMKRLLSRNGEDAVLCACKACPALGHESPLALVRDIMDSGECYSLASLAVTGGDLIRHGIPAGPALGGTLRRLLEHVIDNPDDNKHEYLMHLIEKA